jgi:hypothetical protein
VGQLSFESPEPRRPPWSLPSWPPPSSPLWPSSLELLDVVEMVMSEDELCVLASAPPSSP